MDLPYDCTSKESILDYARLLLGKSLKELHPDASNYSSGKGGFGQTVENYHFQYKPNSESEPDFDKAGVELKCTPLKTNADGSMVSKERLVLNIIDYVKEAQATFYTSSFWHKNQWLLLMFYMHEKGMDVVDLIFKIVRLWNFPDVDKKIIRDDWEKLHWKMVHGLAHEISEGDTLYLGACTKGSKAGAEMRKQIGNAPLAQQRAYSLKSKYLNTIILDSLLHNEMCSDVFLSAAQRKRIEKNIAEASNIVTSIEEYKEEETFEQLIERKFASFYGKTIYEIENITKAKISNSPKAISDSVIHAILGIKTKKIAEFEKANLQQKSIRLEPSGKLKESMVFSQIDYKGIVDEKTWEDSVWYNTLTQRFLFVVFRKSLNKDNKNAILEKVFFWTMPRKDLEVAREFWLDTKEKIEEDNFCNFWKLGDHNICHVRPKAKDNTDKMEAPSGKKITKKGYWLNAEYILDVVNAHMKQSEENVPDRPSYISQYEYDMLKDKSGYIPVYTINGACGYFSGEQDAEIEGWLDVSNMGSRPDARTQYAVHAKGNSMLPKIHDGDLCIFEYKEGTADQGDIVLMECNQYDVDYGGRYTIKEYYSSKKYEDGFWQQTAIELKPLNTAEYEPIHLVQNEDDTYRIVGVLKAVINER